MNIKIYHQNKVIYITDEVEFNPQNSIILHKQEILWEDFNALDNAVIVFYHKNVTVLKSSFEKHFALITAAGGIVENEHKEILWIYRRGFWDLPKGKWDKGETLEQCAIREIEEETGVTGLELVNHLVKTYHTYNTYGSWMLKETNWYYLKTSYNKPLKPQLEEDIEKVNWIKKTVMNEALNNTYPAIKDVINLFNTYRK
jgi:ADP-ribose pyrophosphatase YjhB (NUDIX family)